MEHSVEVSFDRRFSGGEKVRHEVIWKKMGKVRRRKPEKLMG